MTQPPFIEIDLGEHTLILVSNNSLELANNADPIGYGLSLNQDETYRLYLSLHARFQSEKQPEEDEDE